MAAPDTIVALASGALPAGVAVVRLSGPQAQNCLELVAGPLPAPRVMSYRSLRHPVTSEVLDQGLVVYFPAPNSFTGEDCVELQVHGSRAVMNALLRALTSLDGVRLAVAGEFTRRAFENGRLDLVEVDALGDLIAADTEGQRAQAIARLSGGVTARIDGWRDQIIGLMAEVEAQLDFSDEGDVGDLAAETLSEGLTQLETSLQEGFDSFGYGRIVRDGFRVGLGGLPNAGKSSLLNRLAQSDIAIVTDEAGTTRDLREVAIDLEGQLVVLVDSAGIRETDSKAEAEGVRRALTMLEEADLVLWLQAPDIEADQTCPVSGPQVVVLESKSDLGGSGDGLGVSAASGAGIPELLTLIGARISETRDAAGDLSMSHLRDRQALHSCLEEVRRARARLDQLELVAECLRRAVLELERLVGRVDAEQVLDELFSGFCIGK